ncbi:Cof-type HAD-IIB family hydrolase [Nocardioidaceae bacterium SCSIO 66511]|nr:Cof-type HAD-IIB family hydrolase [Nocardioidaceae bacterium SCSIO 66511]
MERHSLRYRWLVTDLDGTLLDRRQRIVTRSHHALDRFQELGGTVLIATGRIESSALPYYRELGLHTPAILHNGARVVDLSTDRTLLRRELPERSVAAIVKVAESVDFPCSFAVFSGRTAYVTAVDSALSGYASRDGLEFEIRAEVSDLRASKVLLIAAERDQTALLAELANVDGTHVVQSERTYLEVLPEHTDKGSALDWLLRENSVAAADVVAIGDGMNDVAMIGRAGLGACVSDAQPDVAAMADLIVGSCTAGGVADVVDLAINGLR